MELQEVIDKQSREQSQMKERLAALSAHVTELEEDLDTARKDLIKSEEVNTKLQRDVREVSDGGRVRCPAVECGSLVLPVISALRWLREQEQSTGGTAAGCLPASASWALGQKRPGPLAVERHEGGLGAVPHPGCGLRACTSSRGPGVPFLKIHSSIHSFIGM